MLGGTWSLFFTFLVSVVGCFLGLVCALRARRRGEGRAWAGWLTLAAVAIGGVGVWLTHFIAMLGLGAGDGPVRYDIARMTVSAALSIGVVFIGLLMFGANARFSWWRLVLGGAATGLTMILVHYLEASAVRVQGMSTGGAMWLPAVIAVVAATVALSFTVLFDSAVLCGLAGLVMGFAVTGAHYTGTTVDPTVPVPVGVEAFTFLFPVLFLALMIPVCAVLTAATRSDGESRRSRSLPARPVPNRPEPGAARQATHTVAQVRGVGRYARLPTIPVQRL